MITIFRLNMNTRIKITVLLFIIVLSVGTSCAQNNLKTQNNPESKEEKSLCLEDKKSLNLEKEKSFRFEVDPEENLYLTLKNGELSLLENEKTIWRANPEHDIENVVVTDIDGDNNTDILVSFWKFGSFGESKPFWFEGKDDEYTNHLFFYEIRNKKVRTRWGSSKINIPIKEMEAIEIKYKGKTVNALKIKDEQGTGIWIWDNWGFRKI